MGGFALAIEWNDAIDPQGFEAMCGRMSHRSTAGLRSSYGTGSALAEGRLPRDGVGDWQLATMGPLTIVGDIRLWNTTKLATIAGTLPRGTPSDDRYLLLAAYRRRGLAMMDAVDGDFAFVIWDKADRVAAAARDRFGVKPLFLARTETGIRFASEPKQLVSYTGDDPTPSIAAAAQHLSGRFLLDRHSAFDGIDRLRPAHALVATDRAVREHRYWHLGLTLDTTLNKKNIQETMRDHLVDSVQRRLASSQKAEAHLSGGLDSASITASASLLTSDGLDPNRLHTVSAVFPDRAEDESRWIADVVDVQPFEHTDFEPGVLSMDVFVDDMRRTDTPVADTLRDITVRPGVIGRGVNADLLLTGNGGDEVAGDTWLLSDILRTGGWREWGKGLNTIRHESPFFAIDRAARSLRLSAPDGLKAPVRSLRRGRPASPGWVTPLLACSLDDQIAEQTTSSIRSGVEAMDQSLPNAVLLQVLEAQEAQLAGFGMEISHPFLDRTLVEFVAGIEPTIQPIMLRDKSLLRTAYRGVLPDSLLDRRGKTHTNGLVDSAQRHLSFDFRRRFEAVPSSATEYIDANSYLAAVNSIRADNGNHESGKLWKAWACMLWTETLRTDRGTRCPESTIPYIVEAR